MKRPALLLPLLAACLTAIPPAPAHAGDDDDLAELQAKIGNEWLLVKNDRLRNIKTWIKQEDGKRYRSFKVEATLDGGLRQCVRTLLDVPGFSQWYWEVMEGRLLRKLSPTEYQIYLKHRAPYGIPDRDVAGILSFTPQTPDNRTLTVQVRAIPDLMPLAPPLIRLQAEDMTVRLTPVGIKRLRIEAEGYVDPGGRAPNWAFNMIQRSAPYSIVIGLQRVLADPPAAETRSALPFKVYEYGE